MSTSFSPVVTTFVLGTLSVSEVSLYVVPTKADSYRKYVVARAVYNVYFHPLAKYDGPRLWTAFRFPFIKALVSGTLPHQVRDFHDRFGRVVRVAPDELSFIDHRMAGYLPAEFPTPPRIQRQTTRKGSRKSDLRK